jgi:zona occludens toxin (predicted ATPase)
MDLKDKNLDKRHSKELGFKTPDDYFLISKNEILSKVSKTKNSKLISFYNSKMVWFVAASIALVFTITMYRQYTSPKIFEMNQIVSDTINTQKNENLLAYSFQEEDVLIASLFVNEANVDAFITNEFINNVLADEYLDEYIIDELMTDDIF